MGPQSPQFWQPPVPEEKISVHDGFAIASLVLGILWVIGIGSVLAVIFGHISDARAHRANRPRSGLAIAGLILGYAGLVLELYIIIANLVT